jgi:hypothetical protein
MVNRTKTVAVTEARTAPAPMVAASATPAVAGAMMRTLRNADRKPVRASMPT